MNRLASSANQAGERLPLLLGLNMVEWLLAIIALLVVAGVGTLAVTLLNRHRASKHAEVLHRDLQEQRQDIERRENRISERETRLDEQVRQLESRTQQLAASEAELEARRAELLDIEEERRRTLEQVAGLTVEDARSQLVESIEADAKRIAAITARDIERTAQEEAEARAKRILATVIQRLASEQTS
jgi:ribonuclease Y